MAVPMGTMAISLRRSNHGNSNHGSSSITSSITSRRRRRRSSSSSSSHRSHTTCIIRISSRLTFLNRMGLPRAPRPLQQQKAARDGLETREVRKAREVKQTRRASCLRRTHAAEGIGAPNGGRPCAIAMA